MELPIPLNYFKLSSINLASAKEAAISCSSVVLNNETAACIYDDNKFSLEWN